VALTYRATVDAQAAEGDGRGLAVVRPAARAAIAWDLMLCAGIPQRQLAPATAAADQTSKQGVAVLGRAMPTCRDVARDHRADRFEPLPAHIALVAVDFSAIQSARALRWIFLPTPFAVYPIP